MSVPAKRLSRSKTRRRRGQIKASRTHLMPCSHCQQPKQPHHVCNNCGYYRGRKVLDVGKRSARLSAHKKESGS